MKTKIEIRARAKKLAVSYLKKRISQDTSALPQNCKYNAEIQVAGRYESSVISDVAVSPRKSVSLVVIQPPKPVRICTYGTTEGNWNGDIVCDSEEVSRGCKYFQPALTPEEIFSTFRTELEDDQITKIKYPDLAALQWVLGDRFHSRISYPFAYVWALLVKAYFRIRFMGSDTPEQLPKDVWDASHSKDTR